MHLLLPATLIVVRVAYSSSPPPIPLSQAIQLPASSLCVLDIFIATAALGLLDQLNPPDPVMHEAVSLLASSWDMTPHLAMATLLLDIAHRAESATASQVLPPAIAASRTITCACLSASSLLFAVHGDLVRSEICHVRGLTLTLQAAAAAIDAAVTTPSQLQACLFDLRPFATLRLPFGKRLEIPAFLVQSQP